MTRVVMRQVELWMKEPEASAPGVGALESSTPSADASGFLVPWGTLLTRQGL